jgi:hypothetical protein
MSVMRHQPCLECGQPMGYNSPPPVKRHRRCQLAYDRALYARTICECTVPVIELFWGGRQCGDCGRPFLADLRPKAAA